MVITNAKTYNAPQTIFYKEADKLGNYGNKLIEREVSSIAASVDLEIFKNQTEENFAGDDDGNTDGPISRRRRYADKKNHRDELTESMSRKYLPDGTLASSRLSFSSMIPTILLTRNRKSLDPDSEEQNAHWRNTAYYKHIDLFSSEFLHCLLPPSEVALASKLFFLKRIESKW